MAAMVVAAVTPIRTSFALAGSVASGDLSIMDAAEQAAATSTVHTTTHRQMGAKRIGQLAIGLAVVGIVLNEMSTIQVVTNSTGVVNVNNIFETAGSGIQLMVVGVIILAASILLSLFGGF
jgi:uncharacterized membrane protein YidH (DUF202 family)